MSTSAEVLGRLDAQLREHERMARFAARAMWRLDARMPGGRLRKARRRVVVVALARRDRRAARRMKGRA